MTHVCTDLFGTKPLSNHAHGPCWLGGGVISDFCGTGGGAAAPDDGPEPQARATCHGGHCDGPQPTFCLALSVLVLCLFPLIGFNSCLLIDSSFSLPSPPPSSYRHHFIIIPVVVVIFHLFWPLFLFFFFSEAVATQIQTVFDAKGSWSGSAAAATRSLSGRVKPRLARSGSRGRAFARLLRENGLPLVYYVRGGYNRWARSGLGTRDSYGVDVTDLIKEEVWGPVPSCAVPGCCGGRQGSRGISPSTSFPATVTGIEQKKELPCFILISVQE